MARIVHQPDLHRCHAELAELGPQAVGTVAECSCGTQYVMADDQRDGPFWRQAPGGTSYRVPG